MTLPVFWAPDLATSVGAIVELAGDEARHAVVVRRIRAGEQIVLTNGAGVSASCEVLTTDKSRLTARVLDLVTRERVGPEVTVVQAIPKGERAELTVEVLTEVGVDRIVPWAAARSVGVWRGERAARSLAKWRAAARAAAKQSRRAWFPEVTDQASTDEVVQLIASADLALVLHEEAEVGFDWLAIPTTGSVVIVVGPEGGLTDEEVATFAASPQVVTLRLGPTVLRTSTAGVAAVAALLSRTPRWQ